MTENQRNASRENGAKSNGPKTEEGKARSSLNSLKHGATAKRVLLNTESLEAFMDLVEGYYDDFQPVKQSECDMVEEMVISKWRQRRDWSNEVALLEVEMDEQTPKIEKEYQQIKHAYRFALAFKNLADTSKALQLNMRYETAHRRAYYRALTGLLQLRSAPKPPAEPPAEAPQPAPEAPPSPKPPAQTENFETNPGTGQPSAAQQAKNALLALARKAEALRNANKAPKPQQHGYNLPQQPANHPVWMQNNAVRPHVTA